MGGREEQEDSKKSRIMKLNKLASMSDKEKDKMRKKPRRKPGKEAAKKQEKEEKDVPILPV